MATRDHFPPLWRALGLSVAIGYVGLGSYAALVPIACADQHHLRSPTSTPDSDKYTKRTMAWIGVRDVSIAAALFAFYAQDKAKEMGIVILSGVLLTMHMGEPSTKT